MKKFTVKFQREFEVTIEASDLKTAEVLARRALLQHPIGSVKLMSILPEGYREPGETPPSPRPFGRPKGGGTPGAGTARVPVLVDQIAKAA